MLSQLGCAPQSVRHTIHAFHTRGLASLQAQSRRPKHTRLVLDAAPLDHDVVLIDTPGNLGTVLISRLDRLVGDLLLVAGKKMGPRQPTELGALVRARAEALGAWAATQRVAVRTEGDGIAIADPESVARALDNMLRNAVEAAPPNSTVDARVVETAEAVEVRVEDHGRGIEPTRQRELFEPFFTTKAEGTGLGLAISRAIARAHGGDLTYMRAGDVTRFALSLPRGREAR